MFRTGPDIRNVVALLAAASLVAAACGGDGGDTGKADVASISVGDGNDQSSSPDGEGTAEAPANSEDAFALYDECMTRAGFQFETIPFDGEEGDGLATLSPDVGEDDDDPQAGGSLDDFNPEAFEEANSICEAHLSNIDSGFDLSPEQEAAMEDANRKWAECMEEQGVDVPDPDTSGGIGIDSLDADENPRGGGTASDQDFDFESFNEAAVNCQSVFDEIPGLSEPEAGQ